MVWVSVSAGMGVIRGVGGAGARSRLNREIVYVHRSFMLTYSQVPIRYASTIIVTLN
jgi:hypothetical protein